MYTGIEFNGKHSFKDYGLTVSQRDIGYPSKIKRQERVPFSNEFHDFSNLYGGQEYEERTLTYTFNILNKENKGYRGNYEDTQLLETKVLNWLMNTNGKVKLIDDTVIGYYFEAELVAGPGTDFKFIGSELTVEFTAYPFKISELQEGHDIWDEINFELDVLQPVDFEINGTEEITLYNVGTSVIQPSIEASGTFEIKKDGLVYEVTSGTSSSLDFMLHTGENKFTVTGEGSISFKFYKELI